MKPLSCAFVGAAVIGASWIGLPAVAFPTGTLAEQATAGRQGAVKLVAADEKRSCSSHEHASACKCARCSASQVE